MTSTAGELVETIRRAAAELCDVDLRELHTTELLDLCRSTARAASVVAAAQTAVIDRVDATGSSKWDGLRSTTAWLRHNAQMTGASAARQVKRARALRALPVVSDRFTGGRLSADQVDGFARVLNDRTASAMPTDEATLATLIEGLSADDGLQELRGWADHVDTDGTEPDPGHRDRGFAMSQGFDGRWTGAFTLSSGDGALVNAAIATLSDRYFRDDQQNHGAGAGTSARSATQRRADAFRDLLLGSATTRVTIDLVIDAADLDAGIYRAGLGSSDNAAAPNAFVTPAEALRLSADAAIRAVVVDGRGGAVLHYGRARRHASPSQHTALSIEGDGTCGFPGCCNPIDDDHHIHEWDDGGPTDLDNMTGLCHEHHTLVHRHGWSIVKESDGRLRWTRPDGSELPPNSGWHPPPAELTSLPVRRPDVLAPAGPERRLPGRRARRPAA